MTARPTVVRHSELLNQLVLDRNTMTELGHVEVLWMYPQAHRVLGFVCRSGFLGAKKTAFKLAQVEAIGSKSILVHSAPEETDAGKVRQLESMIHSEVWSDAGDKLGKITDFRFNPQTGAIAQYLFVSSGWSGLIGELYQLTPAQIQSFGSQRVLVTAAIAQSLEQYRGGIPQQLTKVKERLTEEATQELRSLTKQAEAVTEQTKERIQDLAEQAKERAQLLSERAKAKAQALNEQLKEGVERSKERSQALAEQMKERSQNLSDQVEEGIQTLTVQAREMLDPVDELHHRPVSTQTIPDFLDDLDEDDFCFDEVLNDASKNLDQPINPVDPSSDRVNTPPEVNQLDDDDDDPWI
jgi:uncharacterized protein YrrD